MATRYSLSAPPSAPLRASLCLFKNLHRLCLFSLAKLEGQPYSLFMSNEMTNGAERDSKTGRYNDKLSKLCACCGAPKGDHDAEKPYAQDDGMRGPLCDGFKAIRKAR